MSDSETGEQEISFQEVIPVLKPKRKYCFKDK